MVTMVTFHIPRYDVNQQKVHDLVGGILEKELNKLTPDFIEGITLEEFTFGSGTPSIKVL